MYKTLVISFKNEDEAKKMLDSSYYSQIDFEINAVISPNDNSFLNINEVNIIALGMIFNQGDINLDGSNPETITSEFEDLGLPYDIAKFYEEQVREGRIVSVFKAKSEDINYLRRNTNADINFYYVF